MDNSSYITLTRQSALLDQLSVIATNVANADTTGFRREVTVFSEYVKAVGGDTGSISMATVRARFADVSQGVISSTGSPLDVAIEGDGFFQIETPDGDRLTRAGAFTTNAEGAMVTLEGHFVLGAGGGQIFLPPDAGSLLIAPDGTISADGVEVGRLGVVTVENPANLRSDGGVLLRTDEEVIAAPDARIAQGFLESSNVDALQEITQLIEVQRSYELGQSLIERNGQISQRVIQTLGQPVG